MKINFKKISLFTLTLLIIAAIDNIRNLSSSALFGSSLIFFFLLSAILFLIPVSLIAAELTASFQDKGGIYHWVYLAFGEKSAMLAVWLQWINTMVWYPSFLSFIAGTFAYVINPELGQNKVYLTLMILAIFWTFTLINMRGFHFSAKVNTIFALLGTVTPMIILIVLGIVWVSTNKPMEIHFSWREVFPSLQNSQNWVSLTAIMASFLGMELSGVHVNDIKDPQRNFPKAIFFAAVFILVSMILGSLAIAVILPAKEINLISGVIQVFTIIFEEFNIMWLVPVMGIAIVIGSMGSIINWITAPAKGLLHAAEFGFLPPVFTKKNKNGVPIYVMLGQAILVSIFCLAFLLLPSINAFYWFLTALSTDLYILMYVMMFFAALRLRRKTPIKSSYTIPGGFVGLWVVCILGLLGCLLTIFVSFFPPPDVNVGASTRYALLIGIGNLIMIAPVFLFFLQRRKTFLRK